MGSVIVQLIPMMIAAAVVPFCIILVLLLLRSHGGLFKALAFVSGQTLVRLAQGIGFGSELGLSAVAHTRQGASAIVSTLLLVVGILLWVTALRSWAKQEDPDAPPPRWMARVGSISTLKAFALGIVVMLGAGKQWIFTLYALGVIRETDLPGLSNTIAFLVFILGAQSLVLLPIGLYAVAPKHSSHLLEASTLWLERNNQTIVMVVSAAFGTFFIFKGITGLLR
jgi:hypothetical protein